nr:glycine zipper 2TM domain-containing protein [Nanoarchaeota archaeon]
MTIPNWTKHMLGGGLLAVVIGPPLENYIRNNHNLSDEQKKTLLGTTIGTAGGGSIGYVIGDRVIGKNNPDSSKKKILSTIIGAGGGGVAGYLIGEKLGIDKKDYVNETEQNKEQEGGG